MDGPDPPFFVMWYAHDIYISTINIVYDERERERDLGLLASFKRWYVKPFSVIIPGSLISYLSLLLGCKM